MEKTKRTLPIWLSIILAIFCLAGISHNVYEFMPLVREGNALGIIGAGLATVLTIFALFYIFTGYKKEGSVFFRAFSSVSAVMQIVFLYAITFSGLITNVALFLIAVVTFGLWCVLALGNDLGEAKSTWFSCIIVVLNIATTLLYVPHGWNYLSKSCHNVLLAVIFMVMVIAKYRDKETRGAK